MIVVADTRKLQAYKHLIPNATVVDFNDFRQQPDALLRLSETIEDNQINVVLIVNRFPVNPGDLVSQLRSTAWGKELYLTVVTPHDSVADIDLNLDVDDFIRVSESGITDEMVSLAMSRLERTRRLRERFVVASRTASSALNCMSDYSALVHFSESSDNCLTIEEFSESVYSFLSERDLNVVFSINTDTQVIFRPGGNLSSARQFMLAELAQSNKRMVQIEKILGFSFEHFNLLVLNYPVNEPERCGLLKDSLAHFCTIVESRVKNILIKEHIVRQHSNVMQIMDLIRASTREAKLHTGNTMLHLSQELELAATTFDMNHEEEVKLLQIANNAAETLECLQENDALLETHFFELIDTISSIKTLATQKTDDIFNQEKITLKRVS